MAGSLKNYFSLLYGSTEQDNSESTDKQASTDLDEDIDVTDITDEEEIRNNVSGDQNNAENYGKSSPFEIEVSDEEKHQCKMCRKQFDNEKTFKNHLDMHILYSDNECALCHKVFTLKKNLNRHKAMIHFIDTALYYCLTCPKIFPHPEKLSNHTRLCRSGNPKCYMCSAELESFDDLSVHQENEHNLRGYVCGFCATSLPTIEELGTHFKSCKKAVVGKKNKDLNDLTFCKQVPVGEDNKCSKELKCCKKAPVGEENLCSKDLKCCKKAPVGEENLCSKDLKSCKKASVGVEDLCSMDLKCCKKATVGEENKCIKDFKCCKKALFGKENKCSNTKEGSNIQNEFKMTQFQASNIMPKTKGRKRRAGNELE